MLTQFAFSAGRFEAGSSGSSWCARAGSTRVGNGYGLLLVDVHL
jgi:hypothetical protein